MLAGEDYDLNSCKICKCGKNRLLFFCFLLQWADWKQKMICVFVPRADKSLARPGRKQARKHVTRCAGFQQNRDAICQQVSFPARRGA